MFWGMKMERYEGLTVLMTLSQSEFSFSRPEGHWHRREARSPAVLLGLRRRDGRRVAMAPPDGRGAPTANPEEKLAAYL